MFSNENNIIKLLKNGANGFVLKNCDPELLEMALKEIYYRGYNNPKVLSDRFIQLLQNIDSEPSKITPKEMKFLSLCCSELGYKQIAEIMGLSVRTVEGYRDDLFEKLKIHTRIGLVMYALDMGIPPRGELPENKKLYA